MTAVTTQSNKIVSNKVKDWWEPLVLLLGDFF